MTQRLLIRVLSILLAGLLAILMVLAGTWYMRQEGDGGLGRVSGIGEASIGGSFELVDQYGNPRDDQDFRGRYMLVFFGFTYCPDFCPTALITITEALDRLEEASPDKAEAVVPIFITIDPERDTVETMADYARHFHPSLVALTGSEAAIAEAAKAYRVFYRRVESEDTTDYLMDHSTFVFLMDPDGRYVTHFTHATQPADMAATLQERIVH